MGARTAGAASGALFGQTEAAMKAMMFNKAVTPFVVTHPKAGFNGARVGSKMGERAYDKAMGKFGVKKTERDDWDA